MARDRLAAMRTQQSGGYNDAPSYPTQSSNYGGGYSNSRRANPYAQQDDQYEMSQVHSDTVPLTAGTGAGDDMSAFYSEISSIQDSLRTYNDNVTRISELHQRSLNNLDEDAMARNQRQLEDLIDATSALSNELKNRIKALQRKRVSGPNGRIWKDQTGLVKQKFVESIQNYQQVEQQYRTKYKQRMERQFKIVKPDATPEEVKAVVDNEQGGQIFTQALQSSNRLGASRAAYREVQERHQDIQRIERTITELAQLFNDMSILVEQQDETVVAIEANAQHVVQDTEAGLKDTNLAVESARSARKKRWICFIIIIIIIAIIAIVIAVKVAGSGGGSKK